MKTKILLSVGFLCLSTAGHKIEAVSPRPDGGYPGGNTAEGQNALLSLITGTYNTAVGVFSLESDTAGKFNTATGAGTLLANIADENTATGAGALLSNTIGTNNTANGAFALFSNTSGGGNIAFGANAGLNLTTGNNNIDIGNEGVAGESATIRIGDPAVHAATFIAGISGGTITGPISAVVVNSDGQLGSIDLGTLDGGRPFGNTAEGDGALSFLTTGANNTAMGFNALSNDTDGSGNTAMGFNALSNHTGGENNTALGFQAGLSQTFGGSNNVYIGAGMNGVDGESNTCYIASIFGQTSGSGMPVLINSNNKLGTTTSSKRFKEDIRPMDKGSETLFSLKPVSFRYKKQIDPAGIRQLGLVAEDVEKVNPDLVVCDKEGKPYSVRYDQVNAMLLNEFLKEHRKVQEQEATITQLKKDFRATVAQLTTRLDEQAAQIQKVSAQLEANKPAPQVVNNP